MIYELEIRYLKRKASITTAPQSFLQLYDLQICQLLLSDCLTMATWRPLDCNVALQSLRSHPGSNIESYF